MNPTLVAGSANEALAAAVANGLGVDLMPCTRERFPDGEAHVSVEGNLRGRDVYVVQPTGPPTDAHLVELLLLVDACRRAGAERLTAVVPYFGYARQDRRRATGEPVSARVVADLLGAVRVDRVLTVDPHTRSLEAMFEAPVHAVSAVPVLAAAIRPHLHAPAVLVAPDLGAVKLAEGYAALLGLPVAVVRKTRLSGESVRADQVVGTVRDRVPVVVDDMITTGGTVAAAARALTGVGSTAGLVVAATHGLLVGRAPEVLGTLGPEVVLVTDTVAVPGTAALPVEVVSVAGLLASAIDHLHRACSLRDLVEYR